MRSEAGAAVGLMGARTARRGQRWVRVEAGAAVAVAVVAWVEIATVAGARVAAGACVAAGTGAGVNGCGRS
jgi:hypothetical protein